MQQAKSSLKTDPQNTSEALPRHPSAPSSDRHGLRPTPWMAQTRNWCSRLGSEPIPGDPQDTFGRGYLPQRKPNTYKNTHLRYTFGGGWGLGYELRSTANCNNGSRTPTGWLPINEK